MASIKENRLSSIRGISDGMKGKNYPFNDCMAFMMECLKEDSRLDYWFFSWLTGDGLVQVYDRNKSSFCEYCLSGFLPSYEHIKHVFDTIGYAYEYVTSEEINKNKPFYQEKVIEYINRGIPVLVKTTLLDTPMENSELTYTLYVGYEDYGNKLIFLNPYDRLEIYDIDNVIKQDWIFIGDKKNEIIYDEVLIKTIKNTYTLLNLPEDNGKFYGANAYRAWAEDMRDGRFVTEKDLWANYGAYFCNLATNSWANNIEDAPHASLFYNLMKLYPEYKEMSNQIANQYAIIGSGDGKGGIWKDLTDLGGGFNISNTAMEDEANRNSIAKKLEEAADAIERVSMILDKML